MYEIKRAEDTTAELITCDKAQALITTEREVWYPQ